MRPLVLCPSCHRHVKREERSCPFCSAAVASPRGREAGRSQPGTSPRGLPGGRAALFLAGAALAASCADEPEPDGADSARDAKAQQSAEDAGRDAGRDAGPDAGQDAGRDAGRQVMATPPYGISIDRPDASILPVGDADAECARPENLAAPVYGIAIDPQESDLCRDAGQDAGRDAVIPVPPYGIAIDRQR